MKKVIIIGAGTAGLAAGTYLQKNGYKTEIYESHTMAGGLCTAWKRKNFLIDGCLHWLTDVRPDSDFYQLYLETGAMKETTHYFTADILTRYQSELFQFTYYTDLVKLKAEVKRVCTHLIQANPENKAMYQNDQQLFLKIVRDAQKVCGLTYPIIEMTKVEKDKLALFKWALKHFKQLRIIRKYQKKTVGNLIEQFQTDAFQILFQTVAILPKEMAAIPFIVYLAGYHDKSFVYTDGGSLNIAKGMEEMYTQSGGTIHFKTPVKEIVLKENRASGVLLSNGETVNADIVMSAADGFQTLNQFINPMKVPQKYHDYMNKSPKFDSLVHIAACVNKDLSYMQTESIFFPNTMPNVDGVMKPDSIHYYIDTPKKGFLKENQSVIRCVLTGDYHFFQKLKETRGSYQAKKAEIETAIIAHLIGRKIIEAEDIAYVDIATPTTFYNYTHNYQGSFEGILLTPDNFSTHYDEIETIADLYLVGQWWNPGGGIPTSIYSARRVAQKICQSDKKAFTV